MTVTGLANRCSSTSEMITQSNAPALNGSSYTLPRSDSHGPAPGTLPAGGPPHASEVIVGPFGGLAGLSGFGNLFVQCGTVDPTATGGVRLSTVARVNF